ncbi:MAG: hypothetical protein HOF33_04745 [Rhodospirillaceae bacterium]|nr:hypothetical protein [Rhodospirillaceae bacterium]
MAGKPGEAALAFDADLGHIAPIGALIEQGESSYRRAARALAAGRFEDAAQLGRYTVEEAREGHELYAAWRDQTRRYLLREGVAEKVVAAEQARLAGLLRLDDGAPFDADQRWAEFKGLIDAFVFSCGAGNATRAGEQLEAARLSWRDTHDRACDWVYGLQDAVVRHLGEARIGPLWDELMAPMYETYDRYDTNHTPWPQSIRRLVLVAAESLRGHLSGPGRMGDIEITEEPERWVLSFDPCGSGGRTYRDDAGEGYAPRMAPPYDFAVTEEEHDWAWNKKGICVYCVHCCQLNQRMPTTRFGYPTRVVDPPTWPEAKTGGKCVWSVYKDPSLVPEDAYRQVGAKKSP